jgi:membrane fusion protein, multidrug efflux system
MSGKSASSQSAPQSEPEIRHFPDGKIVPAAEAPLPAPVPETIAPSGKPGRKRSARSAVLPIIGLLLLGAGGWYGYNYWTDGRFMITTDDAYVEADMTFVAPKISGYVASVPVTHDQHVKTGDPLVIVDDGDYRIALDQTQASIDTQHKSLARIAAQTGAARASLLQGEAQRAQAKATADNAIRSAQRATELFKTKVASQVQVDNADTAVEQARAALAGAEAQVAAAQANIGVLEAQYAEAESNLKTLELARQKAERDLSFTVLRAPYDGVVGNLSVEKGDHISPGQKLAVVVPMNKLYIVANFKETQLVTLVPGQKVKFSVDAMDDAEFEGTVSSLAPASGAVFSLLPPENATGNFTKVVQRVPVRIDVSPEALKTSKLRAGLSVVVSVDNRTGPEATTASLH